MDDFKLGWLVGWFEGEGTVTYAPSAKQLRLRVTSTDLETLELAQKWFNGPINGPHEPKNRQPWWYWSLSGHDAYDLLMIIHPHLSARRQAQIANAVVEWCQRPGKQYKRRERSYD